MGMYYGWTGRLLNRQLLLMCERNGIRIAMPQVEKIMACGTKDDLMQANVSFRDFLRKKGIEVTWDEENYGHDWDFWDSQIKKVLDWLPLE